MQKRKILLSCLVVFCMMGALVPHAGAQFDAPHTYVAENSLYGSSGGTETQSGSSGSDESQAGVSIDCRASELSEVLREQLVKRTAVLWVTITDQKGISGTGQDFLQALLDETFSYDDPSDFSDFDYLKFSYRSISLTSYSPWYLKFETVYLTTADEEGKVDEEVTDILDELDVYEASQYNKITKVHTYIVNNVRYDDTLERHSAYDALADGRTVCQGYALLTYRMLAELNVPVRIIEGDGNGGPHAWNIVKIGDSWYNLDVTWDDSTHSNKFFLKGSLNFPYHRRDDEYVTDAFNGQYPMSSVSFSRDNDVTLIYSLAFSSPYMEAEIGQSPVLGAEIAPADASNRNLQWSSSDEAVAGVSSDGGITALSQGSAVLTAQAADGSGKSASLLLSVFVPPDFSKASGWAAGELSSLYNLGVMPGRMLSGFKQPATRAEFTALMVNLYERMRGEYTAGETSVFNDLGENPYGFQIRKGSELRIVNGVSGDRFDPDGELTREQCAKILCAAYAAMEGEEPGLSGAALPYGDRNAISDWALPYVSRAYESGLMSGGGGFFNPSASLTREQAMAAAWRLYELVAEP